MSQPIEVEMHQSDENLSDEYTININTVEDLFEIFFKMIQLQKMKKENTEGALRNMNLLLEDLSSNVYLDMIIKLDNTLFNDDSMIRKIIDDNNSSDQDKKTNISSELTKFSTNISTIIGPPPPLASQKPPTIKPPTIKQTKEIIEKINTFFNFDVDCYKNILPDTLEKLKTNVKNLYDEIKKTKLSTATYTFNISKEQKTVVVNHQLFGDLFLLRSEIPHDFSDIKNKKEYQKIIDLTIKEYIYTDISYNAEIIRTTQELMRTDLNEERSGVSALELIFLSGIPLIKQTKNKLQLEVSTNYNESCIFPLVLNTNKVELVSDADSQANKYYSQIESLEIATEKNYPFLSFDAGSSPTLYSFQELIERNKILESLQENENTPETKPDPYTINVVNLDGNTYISLIPSEIKGTKKWQYTAVFINPIVEQYKEIIYRLNEMLKDNPFSEVSITNIKNLVNLTLITLCSFFNKKPKQTDDDLKYFLQTIINKFDESLNATLKAQEAQADMMDSHGGDKVTSNTRKQRLDQPYSTIQNKRANTQQGTPPPMTLDQNTSIFACKLLLNIISLKSLGDLVPYYVTLIDIMTSDNKVNNDNNYITNKEEVIKFFTDNTKTRYFGALGSADYSLIQTPLIEVKFSGEDSVILQNKYDKTKMVSCVHIKNSDITLPLSNSTKYIFRLMSCISSDGCKVVNNNPLLEPINDIIKNLFERTSNVDFMNIADNERYFKKMNQEMIASTKLIPSAELTPSPDTFQNFIEASNGIIGDYNRIISSPQARDISSNILSIIKLNAGQLDNYVKKFDSFSDMIVELNKQLITVFHNDETKTRFLDNLLIASNPNLKDTEGHITTNDTTDIEIKNDNLYFLCEYIIDYMFQKAETNSVVTTTKPEGGGKRKKKYTRRYNKKQINKRTRKTK